MAEPMHDEHDPCRCGGCMTTVQRRAVEEPERPAAALRAFVAAFAHRPDTHDVLTVATRESGHRDVTLMLGDLRAALAALDAAEQGSKVG